MLYYKNKKIEEDPCVKTIEINRKVYLRIKNGSLGNGGGSDTVYLVIKRDAFNEFVNELCKQRVLINSVVNNTSSKDDNNISETEIYSQIKRRCIDIIQKSINKKPLKSSERRILNYMIFDKYIKNFRKVKSLNKKIEKLNLDQTKDKKIKLAPPPKDNRMLFVVKQFKIDEKKNKRFKNEINFCLKPHHSNIIQYIEKAEIDKKLSVLMPYYPLTLRDVIINRDDVNPNTKIKMILQICDALKCLHAKEIFHRDLKPENILVDFHNNLVLADFGIAHFNDSKITTKSELLANRFYAAPEQLIKNNEGPIGSYTDIYSLGLIINEMFTVNVPRTDGYTKIGDYFPQYKWLDVIVSSMTKQLISERVNDIKQIINEIKIKQGNLKEQSLFDRILYTENLMRFTERNLMSKKQRESLDNIIYNDLILADDIFTTKNIDELKKYEINYHSFIGYNLDDNLIKLAIQSEILEICKNKFIYESNVIETDRYNPIESNCETYKSFIELINKYKILKKDLSFLDVSNITLKYFSSCSETHCNKILENAESSIEKTTKDLSDSPILFILICLRELLTEDIYQNLINIKYFRLSNLIYPIKLHREAYSLNDPLKELLNNEKTQLQRIQSFLEENFKVDIQKPNKYDQLLFVTFDSSKKYRKFIEKCYKQLDKIKISKGEKYILEGDIKDLTTPIEYGRGTYKIKLDSFSIGKVIELFNLKD